MMTKGGALGWFKRTQKDSGDDERSDVLRYGGNEYLLGSGLGGMAPANPLAASRPRVSGDLASLVASAQPHSVLSASVLTRMLVLSEAWPRWADNETGNLFGNTALDVFEGPEFPALVMAAEQMASFTGNAFLLKRRGTLRLLRSDWVHVVLGSDSKPAQVAAAMETPEKDRREALTHALDAVVIGYIYAPPKLDPEVLAVEDVVHWKPEPHPLSTWLGGSWITSCVRELRADIQVDDHTDKFFEQGATPQVVYTLDPNISPENAKKLKDVLEDEHSGLTNAWRTQYIGGGTDVKVIGSRLKDLGLTGLSSQLETRMTLRSRVPAIVLGVAAGMQGSALNSGNYGQTRRMWADTWFTPYVAGLVRSLETVVPAQTRAHLKHDRSRSMFLQEDQLDDAEIIGRQATSIRTLTDGGYETKTVVAAVTTGDLRLLKHTGLLPVQVQEPGSAAEKPAAEKPAPPAEKTTKGATDVAA